MLKEAVIDSNGRFYFPAWGPEKVKGVIAPSTPDITFIKEGYEILYESNILGVARSDYPGGLKSRWHVKVAWKKSIS